MPFKDFVARVFSPARPFLYLFISFAVWLFCFRGFFFQELGLSSDAISYYEHIQFFLKRLSRGDFPLWDPYWSGGVSNEFFLRRFCPYNPLYAVILLMTAMGIPYYLSYLVFLAGYVFLGALGVYYLSRLLTGSALCGFVAYATLLFSSFSTRVFDAYMLLIAVPLIWLFYFLVSFFRTPDRPRALALTFTLMLVLCTYIPIYFVIILGTFLLVFAVLYMDKLRMAWAVLWSFLTREKLCAVFCVLAVLSATVPGLLFFKEAGKGAISVPGRHYNTAEKHALAVESGTDHLWSAPEEFYFSSYYADLKRIIFAIVYVPCFALIPLALMFGLRVSRLMVFLVAWLGLLLLITSPSASGVFALLREKIFLFKYFRNLHFLLWFAFFPALAVLVAEAFRLFLSALDQDRKGFLMGLILVVHATLAVLLSQRPDTLVSTYVVLFVSLVFFLLITAFEKCRQMPVLWGGILGLFIIQPVEVYHYLARNAHPFSPITTYEEMGSFSYLSIPQGEAKRDFKGQSYPVRKIPDAPGGPLYYATSYYNSLRSFVPLSTLWAYERYKFIVYDQIQPAEQPGQQEIVDALALRSPALVEGGYAGPKVVGIPGGKPSPIEGPSDVISVLKASTGQVALRTNFPVRKLLVFNDAFYPAWRVTVNGKPEQLWLVNGAFKGVLLPPGEARVSFRFGSFSSWLINWALMVLFYGIFTYLLAHFVSRKVVRT